MMDLDKKYGRWFNFLQNMLIKISVLFAPTYFSVCLYPHTSLERIKTMCGLDLFNAKNP